jgi:lambda family phage portal protein
MTVFSRLLASVSAIFGNEGPDLQKRNGIEAGGGGRRWHGPPMLNAPQASILAARAPAKARAAGLSMNNPTGARIVETWLAGLVGKGWQALSQHPDPATRRTLNNEFEEHMLALMPVAVRALVRDGEAFIRTSVSGSDADGSGRGAFSSVALPADQIDPSLTRDLGNGARIVAGVEFDANDRIVAYHILPDAPGTPFGLIGQAVRVPAREVLHVFDQLFPGQVRGMSWLAPVLLKLADFDAASDAMLMTLKVQSLMTGFVRDAEGGTAGFESTDGSLNVSLEPGAMRVLPFGAEVEFSQPGQGLSQAVEFVKGQQREIAVGVGLTYEQVTGDLSGTNYSSARVGLLEFRRRAEMLQRVLLEAQLLRPLWRRWIDAKALAGEIGASESELADYRAVKFVSPGWAWVDPLKEVNGDIRAMEAGLKSRAEIVAGRGRDIAELDEEIAADSRAAKPEATA